jgi:hypothetical protein
LVEFLTRHGSEVENMLLTEWNMETALEVRYDEGVTRGETKVLDLLRKGMSLAEIERMLGGREYAAHGMEHGNGA